MKFYERFFISILNKGSIPRHVAFIMDGNRRYAQNKGMKKSKGHSFGFEALMKTLEWCLELGVKEVSLYAFSIDNFQRDKEEVDVLMGLARDKLKEISEHNAFLQEKGVNVKIYGNLDLAPKDVKETMELVMQRTEKNSRLKLNICFCYDSTYEMEKAIEMYHKENSNSSGENNLSKVVGKEKEFISSREKLKKYMLIKDEPDVLVRTSDEIRLSNFMLFQCSTSVICFLEESWPEMSILSIIKIILKYQTQEKYMRQIRAHIDEYERKAQVSA